MERQRLILMILDGFGLSPALRGNATYQAKTPNLDRIVAEYPYTAMTAHGPEVGLSWGEMGNSEVGHMNLGAGRVVLQEATRISEAITTGDFYINEALLSACRKAKADNSVLHIIGIISPGGVHGHIDHMIASIELARREQVSKISLHLISDGRDATPKSFEKFFPRLDSMAKKAGAKYATLMGRYYAMDRDRRWERVQAAYEAMVNGKGQTAANVPEALKSAYETRQETDEFITPTVIDPANPDLRIKDGDVVIFTNYRPDRARLLSQALDGAEFNGFTRKELTLTFVTFSEYGVELKNNQVAFPVEPMHNQLAEVLSSANLRQIHLAETEKYAHVTYFFNGGQEQAFPLEKRMLVDSPKVPTYDQAPAMSAREITKTLLEAYSADGFDVAIVNYANGDMVGHTGNLQATITAIETIDEAFGQLSQATEASGDILLITADHGNAEQKIHPDTGDIDKEHTANPVPLILVDAKYRHKPLEGDVKLKLMSTQAIGILADVAPTILDLLHVQQPKDMTGQSLLPVLKRYQ
jgi:2,3-bisphosphoglycerate-independent phosphoglycerate mutase